MKKSEIKHACSIKEYKELCEYKYYVLKENAYDGCSVSYIVDTDEKVAECEKFAEEQSDSLQHILSVYKEFKGKVVTDGFHTTGTLIGVELTHEDYYYVVKDKNGAKFYITCVCGIKLV